ncbi:hypothetical protein FRX31_020531 [Thalictrum thalictroides]|uniref:Uncharacterized protein n=1 Tax=Thalictrum thalictroides TaxID=46969 RepID=A0A7J6VZU1_THATH|nr:hypothetical protein FRX31_020531 [Thalictrum thalictroides]
MGDMDLGSFMLLLVLLIYGSISRISYVGNVYVTALESSSKEITDDDNHILGYSFTGIHYEVRRSLRIDSSAAPPPPTANRGGRWKRDTPPSPPTEELFPPPPDAPFDPPSFPSPSGGDAQLPSYPPPPEAITPPSY